MHTCEFGNKRMYFIDNETSSKQQLILIKNLFVMLLLLPAYFLTQTSSTSACLQVNRPLRWVPSCLVESAMATGILFTFTTTTRWVYISVCLWVRLWILLLNFHFLSLMSVWWVHPLKFYIVPLITCTILLIRQQNSFWANRALWIELEGFACAYCYVSVCLLPFHSCIFTTHLL